VSKEGNAFDIPISPKNSKHTIFFVEEDKLGKSLFFDSAIIAI